MSHAARRDPLRIGVLSDTHGHRAKTERVVDVFHRRQIDLVIHCGDTGSPEIVELLSPWPAHFVFGNVDDPSEIRPAIVRLGKVCHERFGAIELDGLHIAFLHGDDGNLFRETAQSGQWDLVCFGHSHVAEISQRGPTKLLNPGAVYRSARPSVAIVEIPALTVALAMLRDPLEES
jgi:putative phosphoesterase